MVIEGFDIEKSFFFKKKSVCDVFVVSSSSYNIYVLFCDQIPLRFTIIIENHENHEYTFIAHSLESKVPRNISMLKRKQVND